MAKISVLVIVLALVVMAVAQVSYKSGNCPLKNTVTICTPRCVSDHDCSFNRKCCPNKCGYNSCVESSPVYTGSDGGYKSSRDGVYCAGVKCGPYEKCEFDRKTKAERCVRT